MHRQRLAHLLLALVLGSLPLRADDDPPVRLRLAAPLDYERSPHTGYTRAHWIEITEKLIAGLMPHIDPDTGMPDLPRDPGETGHFKMVRDPENMEISNEFAEKEAQDRTLMLIAIYVAATGRDTVPGWDGSITRPFLTGIIRGTDPRDPVYWNPHNKYDSHGHNLAKAILIAPEFFWEPLTADQQANVLEYLGNLAHIFSYDNNHWYFHQVAVPVLEKYGFADTNREELTEMLDRTLNWYRGRGWYIDGANRGFDLYNVWGFHLYNEFLYLHDAGWRERFGERMAHSTRRFFEWFPYLFGRDGGPVSWGRSTNYRFAVNAPVAWAIINGHCPLPMGQARRITSGALRYFWEHGAMGERGTLELGFRGSNTIVPEIYHETGSPYWAAHGLAPLLLPEDHPFWTETEQPMPADGPGGRLAMPEAELLIKVSPIDGEVRLYPVGQPFSHWGRWQRGSKYTQYAYSSYLGYAATGEGGPELGAGRTGLSFDGQEWHYRSEPKAIKVAPDHLVSVDDIRDFIYERVGDDPDYYEWGQITTHTLIGNHGELHIFWHNSPRPSWLHLGGYGISVAHGEALSTTAKDHRITLQSGPNSSAIEVIQAPEGTLEPILLEPREGWQHSHNFEGKGAYPIWRSQKRISSNEVIILHVDGARGRPLQAPDISVERAGEHLHITFEGRSHTVQIPH